MAKSKIRAIALCVFRHGDRILVHKGYDRVKDQAFYRPLGGGIDFGESSQEAAIREIREELGVESEQMVLLGVIENRFELNGKPGHEIVFIYDGVFTDATLYDTPVLVGHEGKKSFDAIWIDLKQVAQETVPLYPPGLFALLTSG